MAIPARVRLTMTRLGLEGINKPKRTPKHPTKSHVVLAADGGRYQLIRFGQQGGERQPGPQGRERSGKGPPWLVQGQACAEHREGPDVGGLLGGSGEVVS